MSTRAAGSDAHTVVGVVGPSDHVSLVGQVAAREYPLLSVRAFAYRNEAQALQLVRAGRAEVDAWLFTGIIPYTIVRDARVTDKPATYISYTGASLYRTLLGVLAHGRQPTRISIDTLERSQVLDAFRDAGLPVGDVRVMEYRSAGDATAFADFHRTAARTGAADVAVTCVRSVYDAVRSELEAIRLSPALASVRSALRAVAMVGAGTAGIDAQVVLGLIELSEPDPELSDEVGPLSGSVFTVQHGRYLLVTTRDALEQHTGAFQRLPLLSRLTQRHRFAHIGLGAGSSAAEAEALARHALSRCRTAGPFAATLALDAGSDIVFCEPGPTPTPDGPVPLLVAARRSGLPQATLIQLRALMDRCGADGVTAGEVATALGVEARSARRTLKRLERAGVAECAGRMLAGTTGRPPTIYRLRIE